MNEKSQRARKEAQAASASGRCSGRSLPQPRAPSGRRLAARSRAVMLPCQSSERPHLFYLQECWEVSMNNFRKMPPVCVLLNKRQKQASCEFKSLLPR